MLTKRILVIMVGIILSFLLTAFGTYIITDHTTTGRLAIFAIRHSHDMTDQQLVQAVGQDPFAVVRRAGRMMKAVDPIVSLILGILVGCFERRMPGKITVLVLMPYSLWAFFKLAFAVPRPNGSTALEIVRTMGIETLYIAIGAFAAIAVVRFLGRQHKVASATAA
ncbi:MAG TPA: hypothetical protein VGN44_00930 [Candidatus Angelobacter sp.]